MNTYQINNSNSATIDTKFSTIYMVVQDQSEMLQKTKLPSQNIHKTVLITGNQNHFRVFQRIKPFTWTAYQIISHENGEKCLVIPDMVLPSTLQLWILITFTLGSIPLVFLPLCMGFLQKRIQYNSIENLNGFCETITQE